MLDTAIDPYARPLAHVPVAIANGHFVAADLHLQRQQREAVCERLAAPAKSQMSGWGPHHASS